MNTISGSVTPTMLQISCAHMPAQLTTVSASIVPLLVEMRQCFPVHSRPVTLVCWLISTPPVRAPRAYA